MMIIGGVADGEHCYLVINRYCPIHGRYLRTVQGVDMNTLGAGDFALRKAQSENKQRANSEAFSDSASEALLSGRDYGAATHDGVINRISDTEDLIEMLIESRKSGRWSSIESLIDKAIDDEIGEALKLGVAA